MDYEFECFIWIWLNSRTRKLHCLQDKIPSVTECMLALFFKYLHIARSFIFYIYTQLKRHMTGCINNKMIQFKLKVIACQ